MPIPPEGYPRTATISPRVQVAEFTGSTNADLVAHATDAADWPHLSVLLTTDQREGRGRMERTWTTPPGSALAVSVLVRVPGIPPAQRGWIPLVAGAAMTRAIAAQLPDHTVGLKWPNDVLVDGLKICGVLAEVVNADTVVIGTGVNTRMAAVDLPVSTATSFAAMGETCDDDALMADYLTALDEQLTALAAEGGDAARSGVRGEIEALCLTLGREVKVHLPGGGTLEGVAQRLDDDGRLVVSGAAVSAGDVVHVR